MTAKRQPGFTISPALLPIGVGVPLGWVLVGGATSRMLVNTALRPYGEPLPKTSIEILACCDDRNTQALDPYDES